MGLVNLIFVLMNQAALKQWHYPGQPWGGVPLWLFTLWAGFGLFTRRLILPLLPQPNRFDRMS
jgi:hypothetical protein